ncbi:FG-GAP repeat protein [Aeoliella mucimassa]|uniref:FG-GAP repeat protein n=2 Tax=Aeoliella mucimassa TaxID=2527972 RepID=A0A518APK3_9BACT|nr:FG-GAP repeat protein [Aeoliella mucimassa]
MPGSSEDVSYEVTVSNRTPHEVQGVEVEHTLSALLSNAQLVGVVVSSGSTSSATSGALSSNWADTVTLAAGGSITYQISATVNPSDSDASSEVLHSATAHSPAGLIEFTEANNRAALKNRQHAATAGTGIFYADVLNELALGGEMVKLGDLDGDGDLDAFLGDPAGTHRVFLQDASGRFVQTEQVFNSYGNSDPEEPRELQLEDIDQDGDLDVVVTGPVLQVLLNRGDGQFDAGTQHLVYLGNTDLSDIDGDGDLDLVTNSSSWGGETRNVIFLNDGYGNFVDSGRWLNTSNTLVGLASGDFDGDGDIDLVSLDYANGRVWLNNGSGQFTRTSQMLGENDSPADVQVGDLDGDGDLDIVLAARFGRNRVWLNDGSGTFVEGQTLALSNIDQEQIGIGDIDGDGDLDVAMRAIGGNGNLVVWVNDGAANFQPTLPLPSDVEVTGFDMADIDGNGSMDFFVLLAGESPGSNVWLNSDTDLRVQLSPQTGFEVGSTQSVSYTLTVDNRTSHGVSGAELVSLFGTGLTDVVLNSVTATGGASSSLSSGPLGTSLTDTVDLPAGSSITYEIAGTLTVPHSVSGAVDVVVASITPPAGMVDGNLSNNSAASRNWVDRPTRPSAGVFVQTPQAFDSFTVDALASADLNFDGYDDLVVGTNATYTRVLISDGTGQFVESEQQLPGGATEAVAIDDVDGDGDRDIIIAHTNSGTRVWLNDGAGHFTDSGQTLGGTYQLSLATADLDNDGDVDLITGGAQNKVWLNDGLGGFTASAELGDSRAYDIDPGDIDGDGDTDLMIVGYDNRAVFWINDGNAGFVASPNYISNVLYGGALHDFDGDGDLDAVLLSNSTSHLIWLNDGDGVFTSSGAQNGLYARGYNVQLIDAEGDGDMDFLYTTYSDSSSDELETRLLINQGDATFVVSSQFLGDTPNAALVTGDFDGDGDSDIAVGRVRDNRMGVFLNADTDLLVQVSPTQHLVEAEVATLVSYEITVTNFGPTDIVGASLTHELTDALEDASITSISRGEGAETSIAIGTFVDVFSGYVDLPAGASITFTVEAMLTVPSSFAPIVTSTTEVTAPTGILESYTANNRAQGSGYAPAVIPVSSGRFVDTGQSIRTYGEEVKLGDLDGDGDLDAIVIADDNTYHRVLHNRGDGTFDEVQQFGVEMSHAITLVDIDSDGDLDAVLSGRQRDGSVWLNDGTGLFQEGPAIFVNPASTGDALPVFGDLDGDGDLDAYVARSNNQPNEIWLNDGLGNFVDSGQRLGSSNSRDATLADYDGDGDLDAFVANYGTNYLWTNNGSGSFTLSGYALGSGNSFAVFAGDFTGDGVLEVLFGNTGSASVLLVKAGRVYTSKPLPIGSTSDIDLDVADLDGDGDLDVLLAASDQVLMNDGDGNFAAEYSYDFPNIYVALGDLDGDGDIDAYFTESNNNSDTVWLNAETDVRTYFTQTPDTETVIPGATLDYTIVVENAGTNPVSAATVLLTLPKPVVSASLTSVTQADGATSTLTPIADLEVVQLNDTVDLPIGGKVTYQLTVTLSSDLTDYVSPSAVSSITADVKLPSGQIDANQVDNAAADQNLIRFETSLGSGVFQDSGQRLGDFQSQAVVTGDVDGDGDIDAIVANDGQAGNRLWLNDGSGMFTDSGQMLGNYQSTSLAIGDVDSDGDLDLLIAYSGFGSAQPSLFLNDGVGNFTVVDQGLTTKSTGLVALLDLNNDGALDAMLGSGIYLNNGLGYFTQVVASNGTPSSYGDVDGDGDLDLLNGYRLQLNRGDGSFEPAVQITNSASATALFDADGDGDLDIIFDTGSSNTVWLNDGNGSFTDSGQVLASEGANDFEVGDIDGDGDLDILQSGDDYSGEPITKIWLNDGAGVFAVSPQVFPTDGIVDTALADLDGDGDLDVFMVSEEGANQVWLNPAADTLIDLRIEQHTGDSQVDPGQQVTYVFTVHNDSVIDTQGAMVEYLAGQYLLDVELISVTATGTAESSLVPGTLMGNQFIDTTNLPAGASLEYVIRGTVAPAGTPGLSENYRIEHKVKASAPANQFDPYQADNLTSNVDIVTLSGSGGSGLFVELPQSIDTEDAVDVEMGDLDGDGDLDAIVVYNSSASEVLLNDGAGNFSVATTLFVPEQNLRGTSLAMSDLDNDGDLDVVISTYYGSGSGVWLNNGDATFELSTPSFPGQAEPASITFVDIDNDGDPDLLTGSAWYANDGTGTFSTNFEYLPNSTYDLALGDMDGDGDLDALGYYYQMQYDGITGFSSVYDRWPDSGNWVVGDLNGDGKPDAIRYRTNAQEVWINDGNGRPELYQQIESAPGATEVRFVDVDGDDDLDLVSLELNSFIRIRLNDGNANFVDTGLKFASTDTERFSIGDVDGDGDLDALTVGPTGMQVWTNLAADELANLTVDVQSGGTYASAGDTVTYTVTASNPSKVDILNATITTEFSHSVEESRLVSVLLAGGASGPISLGTFNGEFVSEVDMPAGSSITFVIEVDLLAAGTPMQPAVYGFGASASITTEDGYDAAPGNNTSYDVDIIGPKVTGGTGKFSVADEVTLPTESYVADMSLGDVDGDGDLDVLVVYSYNGGAILTNDGAGNFTVSSVLAGENIYTDGRTSALADVDGDGDLDAFVRTKWFINDGTGSFTNAGHYVPDSAVFGDVDGDGDIDAIAEGRVRFNDGTGVFSEASPMLGSGNLLPQLADLDGDGDLDALYGGAYDDRVVWLNNGEGLFTATTQTLESGLRRGFDLGDLDNDGDLDLWMVFDDFNRVYLNDGNAVFTPLDQEIPRTNYNTSVSLTDIDGDGDLDALTTVHDVAGVNSVFVNDGNASFTESTGIFHPQSLGVLAVGDLDNDGDVDAIFGGNRTVASMLNGDVDLAVTLESPGETVKQGDIVDYTLTVTNNGPLHVTGAELQLLFDLPIADLTVAGVETTGASSSAGATIDVAEGRLTDLINIPVGGTVTYTLQAVVAANDGSFSREHEHFSARAIITPPTGLFDAVPENSFAVQQDQLQVVSEVPSGIWVDSGQQFTLTGGLAIAAGDLDGDGQRDLVIGYETGAQVWWNNDGTFVAGPIISDRVTSQVAVGDFDEDGDLDVAIKTNEGRTFFANDGYGNLTKYFVFGGNYSSFSEFTDVDGDGDLDFYDDVTQLNDGNGYFVAADNSHDGASQHLFGDFNGDGDLDLYTSQGTFDNVGHGFFQYISGYAWSESFNNAQLGDMDGDGDLDAVIAVSGANRVWLNDGSGALVDSGQLLGSAVSNNVSLADFDGDGDLDALFANGGSANVLWLNDGLGNLTYSGIEFDEGTTNSFAISDFNGDGTLDVVSVNSDGPTRLYHGIDIRTQPDLSISLTSSQVAAELGARLYYTLVVTNNGPVPVNGATITARFDRILQDFDIDSPVGTGGAASDLVEGAAAGEFIATVDLPVGASLQYIVSAIPKADAVFLATDSVLSALASVSVPEGFVSDITPDSNAAYDNDLVVLPNAEGSGTFNITSLGLPVDRIEDVALGDVDGDGDLDAVITRGTWSAGDSRNANGVWLNDGHGNYVDSGQELGTSRTFQVMLADFDGDGDLDALFGNHSSNSIWLNDGSGVFTNSEQVIGHNTTYSIAIGDLDGDGDVDIYETDSNAYRNYLWINDGTGVFTSRTISLPPLTSSRAALGDFDGDGDLDVLRVGIRGNSQVMLNDGYGNFLVEGGILTEHGQFVSAVGDLDGDGDLDAVITIEVTLSNGDTEDHIQAYLNNGTGEFTPYGDSFDARAVRELELVDIDHDNDLDLVAGVVSANINYVRNAETVWHNDGSGKFTAAGNAINLQTGYSVSVAAGDVDQDGDPDIVFINDYRPPQLWLNSNATDLAVEFLSGPQAAKVGEAVEYEVRVTNHGSVRTIGADFSSTLWPLFVDAQIADLQYSGDGSSTLEIGAVGNSLQAELFLDPGESVTFVLKATIASGQQVLSATNSMAALNVQVTPRSGEVDSENANNKSVFQTVIEVAATSGTDSLEDSGQQLGFGFATDVALGDIDGDGDLDALIADRLNGNYLWRNNGHGVFEVVGQPFGGEDTVAVALGDLNGDGRLDAVVANRNQSIAVYRNSGNGNFVLMGSYENVADYRDIAVADFDNDGLIDLFIDVDGENVVWRNVGNGIFDPQPALVSSHSSSVALGDVDGDGDIDAVVANEQGEANRLWINDGTGQFVDSGLQLGEGDSVHAALADLDGDGDLDAVIANQSGDHQIWLNDGFGDFGLGDSLLNSVGYVASLALGDMDGDGDIDVVIATSGSAGNLVWMNHGDATFEDTPVEFGNASTFAIALGDLDADGDVDVVSANAFGPGSQVWLNQLTLTPEMAAFNGSGRVDLGDYTIWRDHLGATVERGTSGDADGNGIINRNDYEIWKALYGTTVATPVASAVIAPNESASQTPNSEAVDSNASAPDSIPNDATGDVANSSYSTDSTQDNQEVSPSPTYVRSKAKSDKDSRESLLLQRRRQQPAERDSVSEDAAAANATAPGLVENEATADAALWFYSTDDTRDHEALLPRRSHDRMELTSDNDSSESVLLLRRQHLVVERASVSSSTLKDRTETDEQRAIDEVFTELGSPLLHRLGDRDRK